MPIFPQDIFLPLRFGFDTDLGNKPAQHKSSANNPRETGTEFKDETFLKKKTRVWKQRETPQILVFVKEWKDSRESGVIIGEF